MDRDKVDQELERLQNLLSTKDPSSEEYSLILKQVIAWTKLALEVDKAHDDNIERHDKYMLEVDKYKLDIEQAARRKREALLQVLIDIAKIGFSTLMTVVTILVTGRIESSVIIGQHKWSLIQKALGKF